MRKINNNRTNKNRNLLGSGLSYEQTIAQNPCQVLFQLFQRLI